ncbi:Ankyrin repeat-containing domain [Phytophthora cactorum]|nr:Ankyrin repeat-containing domain [Phytophthora cactorum]
MASLEERLRLMAEAPRRRQRGQIPKALVDAALTYQREFVHRSEHFNTSDISDCAETHETRQMMWEDHYATQLHTEQSRNEAARQQKLRQETAMLTQLKSDTDKWNMAIQLRLLEYIDVSLSAAFEDVKSAYFVNLFNFLATLLTKETEGILLSLDSSGHSLLHLAAANGSDGILTELLTSSIRDDLKALVDLRYGHIACVELLLKLAGAKADLRDRGGSNALHLALQQTFDIEKLITVFLLHTPVDQLDATFSSVEEENGQSCLHTAIIKNFRQVAMVLIRSGKVQVNAATRDGSWTPLHLAVITEEMDVIKELLAAGAMLDAVDADGQTPLLQACLGGQLQIVRLLLNAGANPAHQNKQAHSPLHYLSAFCRDRQLLRDIIANGADVNAKSMKLNTPMHFAAMNGNEHGASASVINEDKRSVVYLAKKWRHRSVEDLVRPPEEEDGHGDVHSRSGQYNKPKSPASRQAQLRSMQHHTRSAAHSRPRTG